MVKAKKFLTNTIIALTVLLLSTLCLFFVCINSNNEKQNLSVEQENALNGETKSVANAQERYWDLVFLSLMYKRTENSYIRLYHPFGDGGYLKGFPRISTHYTEYNGEQLFLTCINDGKQPVEYECITLEDTYYKISSEEEYKDFTQLTYQTIAVESGYEIVGQSALTPNGFPRATYDHYLVYTFGDSSEYKVKLEYLYGTDGRIYLVNRSKLIIDKSLSEKDSLEVITVDDTRTALNGAYCPPILTCEEIVNGYNLTVKLTNDITVKLGKGVAKTEQENVLVFDGTFDGGNHTISFTGSDRYYGADVMGLEGYPVVYSSFCQYLGETGTIKNLRIDYSGMNKTDLCFIDDGGVVKSFMGGIVGYSKGTVENCIVDSPRVFSDRYNSNAYYAALVALNHGLVQYCLVEGEFRVKAHEFNLFGNVSGVNAYWGCIFNPAPGAFDETSTFNVQYCVFNAAVIEEKMMSPNADFILSPADLNKKAESGKQLSYTENAVNSYDINNGGEPKTYMEYSKLSSVSSKGGYEDDTYWYFAHGYNGDVPYLRSFMNWKDISFVTTNKEKSVVEPESIYVPQNYGGCKSKGAYSSIEILDQTINVKCEEGYIVNSWDWDEKSRTYTIQIVDRWAYFKFINQCGKSGNVEVDFAGLVADKLYRVAYGTLVSVSIDYYAKGSQYIKSIKYEINGDVFYNVGNSFRSTLGLNTLTLTSTYNSHYLSASWSVKFDYEDFILENGVTDEMGQGIDNFNNPRLIYIGLVPMIKQYDLGIV